MSKIQERVAKLLALADSPNEHEARAALLKARELMAEYKLQPEEVQTSEKAKVIVQTVGVTFTVMTDSWVLLQGISEPAVWREKDGDRIRRHGGRL